MVLRLHVIRDGVVEYSVFYCWREFKGKQQSKKSSQELSASELEWRWLDKRVRSHVVATAASAKFEVRDWEQRDWRRRAPILRCVELACIKRAPRVGTLEEQQIVERHQRARVPMVLLHKETSWLAEPQLSLIHGSSRVVSKAHACTEYSSFERERKFKIPVYFCHSILRISSLL